jgi:LPXTG-motif cell wall-anchored protein
MMVLLAKPIWAQGQTTGQNQQSVDLTADQCIAIINNNSGDQYSATIIQYCDQVVDDQNDENDNENSVIMPKGAPSVLPKTGGVPSLVFALSALVGAGLLTAVVRRRS